MIKSIYTATVIGFQAYLVQVEVDIRRGLPGETIVGLPNAVVKESKSRIKSAIRQAGFEYPVLSYTISLAPANLRKIGAYFDLPIAVAILVATKQIPYSPNTLYVGELGLTGELKHIPALPIIGKLVDGKKITSICFPFQNSAVSKYMLNMPLLPIKSISDLRKPNAPVTYTSYPTSTHLESNAKESAHLESNVSLSRTAKHSFLGDRSPGSTPNSNASGFNADSRQSLPQPQFPPSMNKIVGHDFVKQALKVSASGRHNILLVGPPGSGKSLLADCIKDMVPDLSESECYDQFCVQSLHEGPLHKVEHPNFSPRPSFISPHHSISMAGLIGGGHLGKPGALTRAHLGVLFLDELGEISRHTLDVLRMPLETHTITLSRQAYTLTFPCDVLLVAAMNPCPCGYYGSSQGHCICGESAVKKYWSQISGPFLDRFDMMLYVNPIPAKDLLSPTKNNAMQPDTDKSLLAPYIDQANQIRHIQFQRQACFNGRLTADSITTQMNALIDDEAQTLIKTSATKLKLSSRSIHNIIKVARTIADIEYVTKNLSANARFGSGPKFAKFDSQARFNSRLAVPNGRGVSSGSGSNNVRSTSRVSTQHVLEALSYRTNVFRMA